MNASQIADQAIAKIEQEEIKDAPVVEEPKKPIAPKDNTTDKDKKDESKPADDKKADEEEGKFTADETLPKPQIPQLITLVSSYQRLNRNILLTTSVSQLLSVVSKAKVTMPKRLRLKPTVQVTYQLTLSLLMINS
jgi:hypothetical protein